MTLTTEQRDGFKKRLLEEERHLSADLTEADKNRDFGDDVDGFEEETNETEQMANTLGVKSSLNSQLAEVRAALTRLEKGTYGVCVRCGKEIELAILEALPSSTLCKECKRAA